MSWPPQRSKSWTSRARCNASRSVRAVTDCSRNTYQAKPSSNSWTRQATGIPPTPPARTTGRSSQCARCRSRPPIPAPPTTCSPATSPHGITHGPTSQSTTPSSPSNASTASGSCLWPTLTLWPAPPPTTSQANASTRSLTLSTGPPHNATLTQATPSSRTTQVGFDQPCRHSERAKQRPRCFLH
jgi:hypothetical protein